MHPKVCKYKYMNETKQKQNKIKQKNKKQEQSIQKMN